MLSSTNFKNLILELGLFFYSALETLEVMRTIEVKGYDDVTNASLSSYSSPSASLSF